ncbi:hypothetical protein Tco_1576865 [Tanacetum coccineum]
MSSPNHPTSDIEDAFSSSFPDYIPASPDYVQASPGKTYSSSSNNSFGLVPIASPTLSLFHDDPYMKVMHAYYAKESPIPPPTIVPPSSMLSPIKQMGNNSKIALARFRIANLEQIIKDIRLHNETRAPNTPLGVADSVSADLEAQVDKMANSDNTSRAPTDSVFDVEMEGFPFVIVNTKEYHSECSGKYHNDIA